MVKLLPDLHKNDLFVLIQTTHLVFDKGKRVMQFTNIMMQYPCSD